MGEVGRAMQRNEANNGKRKRVRQDEQGGARQKALFVADVPHVLNGLHSLIGGAGVVVLNDDQGGIPGVKHLPEVGGDHVRGELDAHQVADPHGVGHAGDVLDGFIG